MAHRGVVARKLVKPKFAAFLILILVLIGASIVLAPKDFWKKSETKAVAAARTDCYPAPAKFDTLDFPDGVNCYKVKFPESGDATGKIRMPHFYRFYRVEHLGQNSRIFQRECIDGTIKTFRSQNDVWYDEMSCSVFSLRGVGEAIVIVQR